MGPRTGRLLFVVLLCLVAVLLLLAAPLLFAEALHASGISRTAESSCPVPGTLRPQKERNSMTTTTATRPVPQLDREQPSRFETATFGLG